MHTASRHHLLYLLLSIFICIPLTANASLSSLLKTAEQQISNKQWQQAVDTLLPQELSFAGSPDYDYLLGIALLGNKQSSMAVQVLQRTVDIEPNFSAARLSLASALFEAGDYERARFHFELLQTQSPPQQVAATIERYLRAINAKSKSYRPSLMGYIEASTGYDSNVNAATSDDLFLGFALSEDNIEVDSPFASLGGGVFYSHPLNPDWRLSGIINLNKRINSSAHFVDMDRADVSINIDRITEFGRIYSSMSGFYMSLDDHYNNKKSMFDLGFDYNINNHYTLNLNALYKKKLYHDSLRVRNANTLGMAASLIYKFDNNFDQIALNLGAYQDDAQLSNSPYSNDQIHGQLFVRNALSNLSFWQLQLSAMRIDYDNKNLFFGTKRQDDKYVASASLHWLDIFAPHWQLTTQLDVINNQSNVELFQYDRVQIALTLRKTFE